jgi:hypothetical protein
MLDKEIREYYFNKKKNSVRSRIKLNNNKSLRDVVQIAKTLTYKIFQRATGHLCNFFQNKGE